MENFYVTYVLFAVVAYLILTDKSIAAAFILWGKIIKLWFEKTKWWIMYSPDNPVVKYLIKVRSEKLAKELMDEFKNK